MRIPPSGPARPLAALLVLLGVLAAAATAAQTPRPGLGTRVGVGVIRAAFEADARRTRRAMEAHPPPRPVATVVGRGYREGDPDAKLDVYFPADAPVGHRLPVLVWIHGGAWVSGSRRDAAPYFRLVAAEGYAVVAPDYTLAPAATHPTPVRQLNDVLAYVRAHADGFRADPSRVVLAGDSAGAQLAAQLAALGSNPAYAEEMGIEGAFTPAVTRGIVLHSGVFDLERLASTPGSGSRILAWGTRTTLLAYAGTREADDPVLRRMTVIHHLTPQFPPAWISGGNADPLTDTHSRPLAARLRELDVPVTALFFPPEHPAQLRHLYQFRLDTDEAQAALASTLAFLAERTGASPP